MEKYYQKALEREARRNNLKAERMAAKRKAEKETVINWDCSKADYETIVKIADRAEKLGRVGFDRMSTIMDLNACHSNGMPLDLERLLAADNFNFTHDVFGISCHINRRTGKMENLFVPRFYKPEPRATDDEHGNNPPMINGHANEPTFSPGDLIEDNHARQCIVIERAETPEKHWIDQQRDTRVRNLPANELWFKAYPLEGGSVHVPQSLCKRIRKATKADRERAYFYANGFGKDELKLKNLFP